VFGEFDTDNFMKPVLRRQQQDAAFAGADIDEVTVPGKIETLQELQEGAALGRLVTAGMLMVFGIDAKLVLLDPGHGIGPELPIEEQVHAERSGSFHSRENTLPDRFYGGPF
jgi:hypothetical protein